MKSVLRKWALRLTVTGGSLAVFLLLILLQPGLTYAHQTNFGKYTIYHNNPLDSKFFQCLTEADRLIKNSEFYSPNLCPEICLNECAFYPSLMEKLRGKAFAWGFYNKVVLLASTDSRNNTAALNGYSWNLTQLLAHELIHCYQFRKLGLLHSNPLAGLPGWKWEGYPEYIARQETDQRELNGNISHYLKAVHSKQDWISFSDSTGTIPPYFKSWLLVKYCLEIKGMSYAQLLSDHRYEDDIYQQMISWHQSN